ncbi:SIS domain-containing protein [Lactobacillus xylocopicola]|uniref:SIS domain-containing protein n=1 Tax=Lactobacillus xylocopicola TaxID=2976676 RepID=A0ABM8BFU3_9LACO|nr:SIS domain-containing protein [Lactobacillus xylocopicola]BDR60127.1 SIS domain-containing protein [Lactobacillus xylocopicola]
MKSIEDYVKLEPQYYRYVLANYQELFVQKFAELDTSKIDNVVIYATGSSANAAYGALPLMSKVLGMPVQIEEPSIAENYLLKVKQNTLCIAISQGGHSYSVVKLIERLQATGHAVFTLTSELTSPVARVSQNVLTMGMPVEEMPYVSAGYSIEILDLMIIALTIAQKEQRLTTKEFNQYLAELRTIAQNLPDVIRRASEWVARQLPSFVTAKRLMFIGYGAAYGVSREGETKTTEAVRISSWGKELEEYMHGPYLGLTADDFIICLEPNGKLQKRADLLKQFLDKHVNNIYTIYANDARNKQGHDLSLGIETDELLTALFMTVPVHLLAYSLSKEHGHDLQHSAYPDFDEITSSKI